MARTVVCEKYIALFLKNERPNAKLPKILTGSRPTRTHGTKCYQAINGVRERAPMRTPTVPFETRLKPLLQRFFKIVP